MRWIKSLCVLAVGWALVSFLPKLKAQSSKGSKVRPPAPAAKRATVRSAVPARVRVKPTRRVQRVVLRPSTPRARTLATKPAKKLGSPGKKVKKIQVACRMVLVISGMT